MRSPIIQQDLFSFATYLDGDVIRFTVLGKPVGYTRTTQRSKYNAQYQKYLDYKTEVVGAFLSVTPGRDWGYPKPLTTTRDRKTFLATYCFFGSGNHPDPSNVHKAIEDALFENDKWAIGCFDFGYDKENPRVEVLIS